MKMRCRDVYGVWSNRFYFRLPGQFEIDVYAMAFVSLEFEDFAAYGLLLKVNCCSSLCVHNGPSNCATATIACVRVRCCCCYYWCCCRSCCCCCRFCWCCSCCMLLFFYACPLLVIFIHVWCGWESTSDTCSHSNWPSCILGRKPRRRRRRLFLWPAVELNETVE